MRNKKIKFIDLSVPIESVPSDPQFMIPQLEYIDHHGGLTSAQELLGCRPEDLPLGLGWAVEKIVLSTHSAPTWTPPGIMLPWRGKKAKTIDQIPLDWCYGNGVVLDFRRKKDGALITVADLKKRWRKFATDQIRGYRVDHDRRRPLLGKPEYLVKGCAWAGNRRSGC